MATTERVTSGDTYRVVTPMDDGGTMRVQGPGGHTEYEVVDYVDELVRERLSTMAAGAAVRLELTPVPGADAHAATRVLPGTPGVGL